MRFIPDPSKQAQKVKDLLWLLTTRMYHKLIHISILVLFSNKTIELLRKLENILPRSALLTIYKTFIRPHLEYGDIIHVQAYNASFHEKLELLQYNACLAITGAIRGTWKEKLYEELGLESIKLRRWYRKTSCFYEFFNSGHPYYLFKIISQSSQRILEITEILNYTWIDFSHLKLYLKTTWVLEILEYNFLRILEILEYHLLKLSWF